MVATLACLKKLHVTRKNEQAMIPEKSLPELKRPQQTFTVLQDSKNSKLTVTYHIF